MPEAIDAMEQAFIDLSSGKSDVPHRYVNSFSNDTLTLLMKPVYNSESNKAAIKIITQKTKGSMGNIPAIVGLVMVLDAITGEVLTIMDGEFLTALRTGAASGLATQYFAKKDAHSVAIFGCGSQGKTQLEAVLAVRDISKIWLFDKNLDHAKSLKLYIADKTDALINIGNSLDALKSCDIICTATNSQKPLFQLSDIAVGTHINAIGSFKPNMQEIDPQILKNALIFVDQMESCLAESGDLIDPLKKNIFSKEHITGEIGDFALGNINGRANEEDITVFKSVGVAIQDFVVAVKVYEKSLTHNFGNVFSFHS
jgi:ornithine cyclodeaminase/alanine dehydrogenase